MLDTKFLLGTLEQSGKMFCLQLLITLKMTGFTLDEVRSVNVFGTDFGVNLVKRATPHLRTSSIFDNMHVLHVIIMNVFFLKTKIIFLLSLS